MIYYSKAKNLICGEYDCSNDLLINNRYIFGIVWYAQFPFEDRYIYKHWNYKCSTFRRIVSLSRNRGNFRGNSNGDSIKEKIREQLKYRDPCEFSSKHSRHVCHGTRRSRNETLEVRVATQSPGSYTWLNVECLVEMMSTADEIIEIGHEIVKLALKLAR